MRLLLLIEKYLLLVLWSMSAGMVKAAIDTREFTSTSTTAKPTSSLTTTTTTTTTNGFAELVTPPPRTKAAQANQRKWKRVFKDYEKYMKASPRKSFIIKKRATIDCHLNRELEDVDYQLSWLKLNRSTVYARYIDSQLLIGLNDRVISPDPRYKIFRENATVWHLTIDDLREEDGAAYYFCQPHLSTNSIPNPRLKAGIEFMYAFQRGVKLQVLTPPEISFAGTSCSQVFANEYESVTLNCTTYSLTKGQHTWSREDKKQHEGQLSIDEYQGPSPVAPYQNVWHGWGALRFDRFTREQAGVYHCTAQNGIEPGKRIRVELNPRNCRVLESKSSPNEPCTNPRYIPGQTDPAELDEQQLVQVKMPTARRPASADTQHNTGWRTRPPTSTSSNSNQEAELTTVVAQEVAEGEEEQHQGGEIAFVTVSDGTISTSVPTLWLISLMIAFTVACISLRE